MSSSDVHSDEESGERAGERAGERTDELARARPFVLVVDDDAAVAKVLGALLEQAGMQTEYVASGAAALLALASRPVDVVLSDLRMPEMDGMELLSRIKLESPELPVVMLTAHGSVPVAVEAMKRGAADFVLKPFDRQEILFVVRKAVGQARHAERSALPTQASHRSDGSAAIRSAAMREGDELITRAARSTATVLLRGESGTGKEVAARLIHARSPRAQGPFIVVHAAALPGNLLESELFGHEKGAFTGAVSRKPGRVELAAGGTLFLDELGDIPLEMQVKLLRLIQEREFQRVGGTQTQKADVRFVAATHRDLEAMVAAGQFREDLLYRLDVIQIRLPPLRARAEDIAPLAEEFARQFGPQNGRPGLRLDGGAIALLTSQPWPGNVRQLQNFVERLVVMSDGPLIDAAIVERELSRQSAASGAQASASSPPVFATGPSPAAAGASATLAGGATPGASAAPRSQSEAPAPHVRLDDQRREAEKIALLEALRRSNNNRSQAARVLGIGRRTLYNKLRELQIE